MATIIGEEINPLLQNQLNTRQSVHGSGVVSPRTNDELVVLSANNSWVKLASGVSISSDRLIKSKLSSYSGGMDLAKRNILFGGTSTYGGGITTQKTGNESYEFGEFGFVPMPGITDVTVKSLNRGAIRKATINITAHNKQQFEIINLLYLHLGYTVMLEWGNAFFLNNSSKLQKVGNTLIENMFFSKTKNGSYSDILPLLDAYRETYHFNYDGMLGKISNYSWSFKKDGTYDIELNLVSMGDVVESLKTNISIDKSLSQFLENFNADQETTGAPPAIESNKNESLLSSYLFLYQFIDNEDTKNNVTRPDITVNNGDKVGVFLNNGSTNLTVNSKTYKFYKYDTGGVTKNDDGVKTFNSVNPERDALDELYNRYTSYSTSGNKTPKNQHTTQGNLFIYSDKGAIVETITTPVVAMEEDTSTSTSTATISNPIDNDPPNVAIKINATTPQYYIKMDYVLKFLKNKIIPNIKATPSVPLVDLVTNSSVNVMYRIGDIHVSLDPRVCIVRNDGFRELDVNGSVVISKAYPELDAWSDSSNKNKAYLNNIYLNFAFIISCLDSSQDEKGNSNLFQFLSTMCDGLNKALGGVNNLEPTIDEPSNSIRIIDSTPIPNTTTRSSGDNIVLFGYEGNTKSNFVRKLDIKTTIPPQMATMVSVGATAGGYVKGVESTAFAKWNKGINDRFKVDYVPPNMSSPIDSEKEVEENYIENFVQNDANAYGLDAIAEPRTFTDSVITKNISTVTEYYRYVFSQNKNSGGSIGFIPFKISFTMDGISGFKIYNKIKLNLKFLSKDYQNFLNFIITEINNKIADQDWETEISAILHPETNIISPVIKRAKQLVNVARTPPVLPGSYPPGSLTVFDGAGWEPFKKLVASGESESSGLYDALNPSTNFTTVFKKAAVTLTVQEVIDLANTKPRGGSGASGLYQMLPGFIATWAATAGVSLTSLFNEAAQDKIAIDGLLEEPLRKPVKDFMAGRNPGTRPELEKAITGYAQIWSSGPALKLSNGTVVGNTDRLGSDGPGRFNQTAYYGGTEGNSSSAHYPVSDVVGMMMKVRKNNGGSRPQYVPSYINWDTL